MKKNFFKQVLSAVVLTMSLAGGAASYRLTPYSIVKTVIIRQP